MNRPNLRPLDLAHDSTDVDLIQLLNRQEEARRRTNRRIALVQYAMFGLAIAAFALLVAGTAGGR